MFTFTLFSIVPLIYCRHTLCILPSRNLLDRTEHRVNRPAFCDQTGRGKFLISARSKTCDPMEHIDNLRSIGVLYYTPVQQDDPSAGGIRKKDEISIVSRSLLTRWIGLFSLFLYSFLIPYSTCNVTYEWRQLKSVTNPKRQIVLWHGKKLKIYQTPTFNLNCTRNEVLQNQIWWENNWNIRKTWSS